MNRIKLSGYDELHDPGSKGLTIKINGELLNLFIVKRAGQIFVYKNACPHTSGPLDWLPDNFLDKDKNYILCARHGALFQIKDGLCVYGPCQRQHLRALPHTIENGNVYLEEL